MIWMCECINILTCTVYNPSTQKLDFLLSLCELFLPDDDDDDADAEHGLFRLSGFVMLVL